MLNKGTTDKKEDEKQGMYELTRRLVILEDERTTKDWRYKTIERTKREK